VIALFWGDAIIKALEGIRPLETKREIEYLIPLFESIIYDVQTQFQNLPRIELCTIDHLTVNAFALGSHTIAVTRGAMETFSEDELKAVMAHEIAHIYYGHSRASLLNALGKGSFTLEILFVRWVSRKLEWLKPYYIRQRGSFLFWLLYFFHKLHEMLINAFLFLGNLILSGNSRKNEFSADRFAYQAGYGKELAEALYLLQKMSLGDNRHLIQRMIASHPRMSKRIQQL
jgi:heat shock protein HtpX